MTTGKHAAVFLDRDGVLVEQAVVRGRPHAHPTRRPPLLAGIADACTQLRDAGLRLVVVSNQPDIARGTADPADVAALNAELQQRLDLDAVIVCPHDDVDRCECRKPKPGMLVRAAEALDIDLSRSVMVGDRWRDIEAGRRAGCITIFLDRGYAERQPEDPDAVVPSLRDAIPYILSVATPPAAARSREDVINARYS